MSDHSEGFADNWAYLRTELRWLDQMLMVAAARQRKDSAEIEHIARSKADRVTSFWWKGVISTEGKAAYDEHRHPAQGTAKGNYQQQLESKIRISQQQKICLALPALCDRLKLTLFEKNLVLMSLAPEINRRYARLYRYLQGEDGGIQTDLPTLDLVLRLLCRNDGEWRNARHHLVSTSPLIQHQLLQFISPATDSILNCSLKLANPLVNYLLAEQPASEELDALLHSGDRSSLHPSRLISARVPIAWSDLVVSAPLLTALQSLVQRLQGQSQAQAQWGVQPQPGLASGIIAILSGEAGTGKTVSAQAIAHTLDLPLFSVDLGLVDPSDYPQLLQEIQVKNPSVLLLKSAHLWLGRSASLSPTDIRQFLTQRRQDKGVTLLSVCQSSAVALSWRQWCDRQLVFPLPNEPERLRLWQKAFPPEVPLSPDIDWAVLAKSRFLTGGTIMKLAQDAIAYAAAAGAAHVEMIHLSRAFVQQGKRLALPTSTSSSVRPTPPVKTAAKRLRSLSQVTATDLLLPPDSSRQSLQSNEG